MGNPIQKTPPFENRRIRTVWDERREKWYFSVVDVVAVLTDSANPNEYIKKMRKRDETLSKGWGQIVTPLWLDTPGGRQRANCADSEGIFRIIQSIPSPKAEPFKVWMAQVASQRIDQMQSPELSVEQAIADYRRLGYSDRWINQRMQTMRARKELTDEWQRAGVTDGRQFASLTDIITQEWSGNTTRQYKALKGLRKESLRDNMTTMELALNMLAEASTAEISRAENPSGYCESARIAHKGGAVARNAREQIESQTGRKIVTPLRASDFLPEVRRREIGRKSQGRIPPLVKGETRARPI